MDFILPSDDTMELMREEFKRMKTNSFARAFALANNEDNATGADNEAEDAFKKSPHGEAHNNIPDELSNSLNEDNSERKTDEVRAYIGSSVAGLFLLLYFVKHLGYNISYGTQIFNTQRGMEQLRPIENHFGQLNNLD